MSRFLCQVSVSLTIVLVFTALLLGSTPGIGFARPPRPDPYERLDVFARVLHVIEQHYVDDIARGPMIDGAIQGMLRTLDPHSSFMSSEERRDFELRTGGRFVGIGIEIGIQGDSLRVIATIPGGPAARAGLDSGDIILAVDDHDVSRMSLDHLFMALRGEPGSTVVLTIKHPNLLAPKTYVIERGLVQTDVVVSRMLNGHYGYVMVKSFGQGTADKVKAEIDKLNRYVDGGLKGLVLDLRKNPGGYLKEGVDLANLFLKDGVITQTRGRTGNVIETYKASSRRHAFNMPLAVLIDEGSASASEIVAGALQDHRRAVIVGTTSFGKASVQSMFPLPDGSSLKLTIGKYYTPNGHCIQAIGITPDIEVEAMVLTPRPRPPQKREKDLERALQATPEATASLPADALDIQDDPAIDDLQLFTALGQLRAREFILPAP
ncbi:MAG: S41 family peptidase [Proteobacteria bacterium]|nr:S41 family peptidase [Pseudomonadota bacterium]